MQIQKFTLNRFSPFRCCCCCCKPTHRPPTTTNDNTTHSQLLFYVCLEVHQVLIPSPQRRRMLLLLLLDRWRRRRGRRRWLRWKLRFPSLFMTFLFHIPVAFLIDSENQLSYCKPLYPSISKSHLHTITMSTNHPWLPACLPASVALHWRLLLPLVHLQFSRIG